MLSKKNRINKITVLIGVIIALLYFAPLYLSNFILFVIAFLLINMLWASSVWAIFHQAGQALFAVVVIAGIGGYASALLGMLIPNTWITIPLALVVSCCIGIFFYILANRVPGHIQFAVLNLTFIFVFGYILVAFTETTGGIDGIKVRYFSPETFFGSISNRYLVVLTLVVLSLFLIHKLMTSRFGRIITLIGRNPTLAATVGINTQRYILLAYLIFTPLIGLGGVLYSHFIGHISPETWNPDLTMIIIFCTLIGGSNSILGPIVGAIIATGIPISFDITAEFRFGIVGIIAIFIFVFKPEGITEWIRGFFIKKMEAKNAVE